VLSPVDSWWLRKEPILTDTKHRHGGGSSSQNIAKTFGVEKLEWCGYPTVKKLKIRFSF